MARRRRNSGNQTKRRRKSGHQPMRRRKAAHQPERRWKAGHRPKRRRKAGHHSARRSRGCGGWGLGWPPPLLVSKLVQVALRRQTLQARVSRTERRCRHVLRPPLLLVPHSSADRPAEVAPTWSSCSSVSRAPRGSLLVSHAPRGSLFGKPAVRRICPRVSGRRQAPGEPPLLPLTTSCTIRP